MPPSFPKRIAAATLLISTAALFGCGTSQDKAARPADVLAHAPPPKRPAPRTYAADWDQERTVVPLSIRAPDLSTPQVSSVDKARQLDFIAHSPIFQKRIDSRTFEGCIKSINEITAELPEDVAKGFQRAARMLMVINLPIEEARRAKRDISDDEIHQAVLKALGNKTTWEVLVAAQTKADELKEQTESGLLTGITRE